MNVRQSTIKLIELIDDGVLDARTVLLSALGYMSEYDVRDMAESDGYIEEEKEEEEEEEE